MAQHNLEIIIQSFWIKLWFESKYQIVKADQRTNKLTFGIVKDILTNSPSHPHGIKSEITNGQVDVSKKYCNNF